ncbi:bifunctional 2-polyprenyl-6-hydroxyphenol methylase/3-demethylubiquinol 3-O-methyltransferase UbiG [uncultured Brevibacillus sp.]|uniref:class I SAM-dependent methyltransferase n=1 Tax=uncultured Brevibacillus sp. TaxID=169970 RepID=UPI0025962DCF|nr:class I SAM-dependent methyltransferase [uncultured Brevibacillus sp.]
MHENCPLCHSAHIELFHEYPSFSLISCKDCDLVFQPHLDQFNAKEIVADIYDADWVAMRDQYAKKTFTEHAIFNILLLDMWCPAKGRLLEIGSGTGEMLYLAREAGWQVIGVEPSPESCVYAQERYGVQLIHSLWEASVLDEEQKGTFDAIVFWHVLEHISHPKQYLEELKEFLKPEGKIIFSVPNKESFTNNLLGFYSPLYTEKDHLFHYSRNNLFSLLRQGGWQILTIFSREETNRLETHLQKITGLTDFPVKDIMGLSVKLQSTFQGHEIFCIATQQSRDTTMNEQEVNDVYEQNQADSFHGCEK